MWRVYACVAGEHDLRLVLLAGFICLFASFAAFGLTARARHAQTHRARLSWLFVTALVTGSGVWSTHFVAMLAFRPNLPLGYDGELTALSVAIAICLMLAGFAVALVRHEWAIFGGAIAGAAIGAMHYVGMVALHVPGIMQWDAGYVLASLLIGVVLAALAMRVAAHSVDLRRRALGASLLTGAICGLHFTAMAAVRFEPDPRIVVPDVIMAPEWLAVAVAAVTIMLIALGFVGALVDQHVAGRAAEDAERLRAHVLALESTKRELEATAANLETALAEAAAGSEAKSQFLATMGHELRTPLNAVIGFAEILTTEAFGPLANERYKQYAGDIYRSGTHLLGLINHVLDFSKLNAGRLDLHDELVEIAEVVNDAMQMVRVQATGAGLALETRIDPALPILRADSRRLRQVLLNLLSNAVKFTPSGGRIEVAAAVQEGEISITVTDTGIGIAPEDLPKALERFGQVDGRLSRKYEGTGLGLPLSKRLIELHGGRFEIESAPGAGTRVRVVFPAWRGVAREASARAA
jgi:signal transduction histidine kinase